MADENRDMPETVANEIARIRKHFEEFGEHRLSDAHFTIRWLADRLEQAEQDSKRLDWLESMATGLTYISPDHRMGGIAFDKRHGIRDAISGDMERASLRAASLPTPKQVRELGDETGG